mgnify:CR=1 FL=1
MPRVAGVPVLAVKPRMTQLPEMLAIGVGGPVSLTLKLSLIHI